MLDDKLNRKQGAEARDQLFSALRLALPGATHEQILNGTKAVEALVSTIALEALSL